MKRDGQKTRIIPFTRKTTSTVITELGMYLFAYWLHNTFWCHLSQKTVFSLSY